MATGDAQLDKQVSSLIKKLRKIKNIEVPRANAKAINEVGSRARTRIIAGVAKETRIKQKDIAAKTYFSRANSRKPTAKLRGYASPVSAMRLLTNKQLASKIGKGTNRKGVRARGYSWPGAFIAPGVNENVHVFQRTGAKHRPRRGHYRGRLRHEVKVVKVEISKPFRRIMNTVPDRIMRKDYKRLLQHELQYRLQKYTVKK